MRRLIVVVALVVLSVMLAAPAHAQHTFVAEGEIIGGDTYLFACDFGTEFIQGQVEWFVLKKRGCAPLVLT